MRTCKDELRDAQDDAERYRDEVERLRRHEVERDAERERQRKEERKQRDPSNRLYNGDVADFHEAVRCHVACLQRELAPVDPNDEPDLRELTERCNKSMREGIAAANKASAIYDSVMKDARERVVAELRAAGLDDWAKCLDSGDYSSMAV